MSMPSPSRSSRSWTRAPASCRSSSCLPPPLGSCTGAPAGCSSAANARFSTPTIATPASLASTPSSRPRSSRAPWSSNTAPCTPSTCASQVAIARRCAASPVCSPNCAPRTSSRAARCDSAAGSTTRIATAIPNPLPALRTGVISTSELATLWQLPRGRVKHGGLLRSSVRRASAPAGIDRDHARILMRDEHGPVSLARGDRKYGHALIGGQGGGKSSVMARHFPNDAADPARPVILIDPQGPLAEPCLGLAPTHRTVHYLDLSRPEMGINPLAIDATPGARAAVLLQALIEANPPGAIQAASDSFLRQAVYAVCMIEPEPTLWHVYRMLGIGNSRYRAKVTEALRHRDDAQFARGYWQREFPMLISDRGYAAQALNPPRNKIERLISTREIDPLLRHPVALDLESILDSGEVLIVAGAKASVGEDNTVLVTQVLLQLLHRALQARQGRSDGDRRRVSLLIDEAHNVLTPSVARMLAEGRSAGLEAVFAWQYSAQI